MKSTGKIKIDPKKEDTYSGQNFLIEAGGRITVQGTSLSINENEKIVLEGENVISVKGSVIKLK